MKAFTILSLLLLTACSHSTQTVQPETGPTKVVVPTRGDVMPAGYMIDQRISLDSVNTWDISTYVTYNGWDIDFRFNMRVREDSVRYYKVKDSLIEVGIIARHRKF